MPESRFGALKDLRRTPTGDDSFPVTEAGPLPLPKQARPPAAPQRQRTLGKSASEEFESLTIDVRKDTKKLAGRKWEDATGQDMSDLVQHLLAEYLIT